MVPEFTTFTASIWGGVVTTPELVQKASVARAVSGRIAKEAKPSLKSDGIRSEKREKYVFIEITS
jgi:hypothetical protein